MFKNALDPIVFTFPGIVNSPESPLQLLNASASILATPVPIFKLRILLQPLNAEIPIVPIESGITKVPVIPVQPSNAY